MCQEAIHSERNANAAAIYLLQIFRKFSKEILAYLQILSSERSSAPRSGTVGNPSPFQCLWTTVDYTYIKRFDDSKLKA